MWQRRAGVILLCLTLICFQGCVSLQNHKAAIVDSLPTDGLGKAKQTLGKTTTVFANVVLGGLNLIGWGTDKLAVFFFDREDDDDNDFDGFETDHLWREGYGFNNPNSDRIRAGQPVQNFDGSIND